MNTYRPTSVHSTRQGNERFTTIAKRAQRQERNEHINHALYRGYAVHPRLQVPSNHVMVAVVGLLAAMRLIVVETKLTLHDTPLEDGSGLRNLWRLIALPVLVTHPFFVPDLCGYLRMSRNSNVTRGWACPSLQPNPKSLPRALFTDNAIHAPEPCASRRRHR